MDRITYRALPYPLPQDAQTDLKAAARNVNRRRTHVQWRNDIAAIDAVIHRLKAMHGTPVTRESLK